MSIFTCKACTHHFNSEPNEAPKCPQCGVLFKENEDLPAPLSIGDLPMPSSGSNHMTMGFPEATVVPGEAVKQNALDDLPAPKQTPLAKNPLDLPAPTSTPASSKGLGDLPAPALSNEFQLEDLPAPALNNEFQLEDLPAPKATPNDLNLPAPSKQAPMSSLGNLPAPSAPNASSGLDLPAPIAIGKVPTGAPPPVPSKNKTSFGQGLSVPPKNAAELELGEPLAFGTAELEANPLDAGLELDNPLDQGLDLPPPTEPSNDPSAMELNLDGGLELDAPTEGAQDLSGLLELETPEVLGEDLSGLLEISPSTTNEAPSTADFDLGGGDDGALDLDDIGLENAQHSAPAIDLDSPIDLPEPETAGIVSFSKSAAPANESTLPKEPNDSLALDIEPLPGAAPQEPALQDAAPREQVKKKVSDRKRKTAKKKLPVKKVAAGALVGALILGGAGYFGFKKLEDTKQVRAGSNKSKAVLASLSSSDLGHWQEAKKHAAALVEVTDNNPDSFALKAETHFASFLATGQSKDDELAKGRDAMASARKLQARGVKLERAEALQALAEGKNPAALKKLEALRGKDNDGNYDLYLAWAYEKTHQPSKAKNAAEAALNKSPKKLEALVVLANSFASLEQKDEAIEKYNDVLKLNPNHIGSMLGVASLVDIDSYSDRENRFLEILKNPNLDSANPNDVSMAWLVTGDEALRSERLDVADERYAKALSLNPSNLDAMVGVAKVLSSRGKKRQAVDKLDQVLSLNERHIESRLTLAEVFYEQKDIPDAASELDMLLNREPSVSNKETLTRMHLLKGHLFASKKSESKMAEESYLEAIKLAGENDLRPTLALTDLYVSQGRGAEAEPLLQPIRNAAMTNPAMAVSLGVAYMKTKNFSEATAFFKKATELRPEDADAKALLGRAYFASNNEKDAVLQLEDALKKSNNREDIGLELASVYDRLGRYDDAERVYASILSNENTSDAVHSSAGRFFMRRGNTDKAKSLGARLLEKNPKNPAGLFLKGESYFAEAKYNEARDLFIEATIADPQPQFLEAAGRASAKVNDFDAAIKYYDNAIHKDPEYLKPRISRVALQIARRDFKDALSQIDEAMEVGTKLKKTQEVDKGLSTLVGMKGLCLLETRDFSSAVNVLKSSIAKNPNHSPSHFYLAKAYSNLSKQREAAASFGKATSLEGADQMPWYSDALRLMGYAHREAGNKAGAISAFKKYIAQSTEDTPQVMEVRNLLTGLQ